MMTATWPGSTRVLGSIMTPSVVDLRNLKWDNLLTKATLTKEKGTR